MLLQVCCCLEDQRMLSLRSPGHHFSRYRSILLALAVCFTFTITFTWYYVTGTKQYPLKDYAASARPAPLYVGHHYSNEAITPRANACFVILTRNRERACKSRLARR